MQGKTASSRSVVGHQTSEYIVRGSGPVPPCECNEKKKQYIISETLVQGLWVKALVQIPSTLSGRLLLAPIYYCRESGYFTITAWIYFPLKTDIIIFLPFALKPV